MNLWKVELILLFRSWRGWSLVTLFLLASIISLITGYFLDKADALAQLPYADVIELYMSFVFPAYILFIGLVVSSMSFDSNQNLSIFLRMRFSFKKILLTKLVIYVLLNEILFLITFGITFVLSMIMFDTSDAISGKWFLIGFLFNIFGSIFWICLITFTSAAFKSTVASLLLTLALVIGFPILVGIATPLELAARGLLETPQNEWNNVSYVAKINNWWPTNTSDTTSFLTVTNSEIAADTINANFQDTELDPWFRLKPLIVSLFVGPLLWLYAWRTYSRREI
jgi:ABC-type transport system involved in multi-copper enzyme maturation permease subunit